MHDEPIWWHDGDPDWWESERRDGPLFHALAAADPFADPDPEIREALARVGALLQAVTGEANSAAPADPAGGEP